MKSQSPCDSMEERSDRTIESRLKDIELKAGAWAHKRAGHRKCIIALSDLVDAYCAGAEKYEEALRVAVDGLKAIDREGCLHHVRIAKDKISEVEKILEEHGTCDSAKQEE